MKKGKANLAKEKDKKQATKKLAFQEFQKYSQYKGLGKYNRQKRNPNQTNNLKFPILYLINDIFQIISSSF